MFNGIEVSDTQSIGGRPVQLKNHLGVSHLGGMSVSILELYKLNGIF